MKKSSSHLPKSWFYTFFRNWDSLHARLNSHYEAWSYKKKKHKPLKANHLKHKLSLKATKIIGQTKTFYRQRIENSIDKETVNTDILATSRNGDRKILQSIRIRSRPPSRKRKWHQLSQLRWTPTKVIPIEKTYLATFRRWAKDSRQASSEGLTVQHNPFCSLSNNSK